MPKFDPARTAPHCESLEPATDAVGRVVGYYLKLADGTEAYMSEGFVRSHFTAAPKVISATPPVVIAEPVAGSTIKIANPPISSTTGGSTPSPFSIDLTAEPAK